MGAGGEEDLASLWESLIMGSLRDYFVGWQWVEQAIGLMLFSWWLQLIGPIEFSTQRQFTGELGGFVEMIDFEPEWSVGKTDFGPR